MIGFHQSSRILALSPHMHRRFYHYLANWCILGQKRALRRTIHRQEPSPGKIRLLQPFNPTERTQHLCTQTVTAAKLCFLGEMIGTFMPTIPLEKEWAGLRLAIGFGRPRFCIRLSLLCTLEDLIVRCEAFVSAQSVRRRCQTRAA